LCRGVGGQNPWPTSIGHDNQSFAAREWLVGKQRGHVEQFLDIVDANDTSLTEQGVRDHFRRCQSAGMGRGSAGADQRRAALDNDNRLSGRNTLGNTAELPRVTERLQVEQYDPGCRVILPILQQVVGRNVGTVTHADEAGDAHIEVVRVLQNDQTHGATLGEKGDIATWRENAGKGGIQSHFRSGIYNSHAVRAHQSHPVAQRDIAQLFFMGSPLRSSFLESIGDDNDGTNTFPSALIRHPGNELRRYDDYGQVDIARDIKYGRIGFYRHYGIRLRVNRVHDAGIATFHNILENELPDASRLP